MALTVISWTGTPLRAPLVLTRDYRFSKKTVLSAGRYEPGFVLPGFTFNGWKGCDETSPACAGCYAKAWARRGGYTAEGHHHLTIWGPETATASRPAAVRDRTSADYWREPLRWDAMAAELGVRLRVFAFSLGDLGDPHTMVRPWRRAFFELVDRTPNLLWLFLTKHPDTLLAEWPVAWRTSPPANVAVGITGESPRWLYRRLPAFFKLSARWRFLSAEPLMLRPGERMDLRPALRPVAPGAFRCTMCHAWRVGEGPCVVCQNVVFEPVADVAQSPGIDWVIAGGMSGSFDDEMTGELSLLPPVDDNPVAQDAGGGFLLTPGLRRWPLEVDALFDLESQCDAHGVRFHMKQDEGAHPGTQGRIPSALWARKDSLPV